MVDCSSSSSCCCFGSFSLGEVLAASLRAKNEHEDH